ncbi:MAG TPA: hypothetical protein VHZ73_11490 [Vicinamibacterales bacterium]|nr:hypothetical protein [Vicinamibacterales bacterium]
MEPRLVLTTDALRLGQSKSPIVRTSAKPSTPGSPRMSRTEARVLAAIGLGIVGFLAGGILGAAIEGDCKCDDPGLKGLVIGAPIGAIVGVVVGAKI